MKSHRTINSVAHSSRNLCPNHLLYRLCSSTATKTAEITGGNGTTSVRRVPVSAVTPTHKHVKSVTSPEQEAAQELHKQTKYTRVTIEDHDSEVERLYNGVIKGDRGCLARSITMAESSHPVKKAQAQVLLEKVLHDTKRRCKHSMYKSVSFRIGKSSRCNVISCSGYACT